MTRTNDFRVLSQRAERKIIADRSDAMGRIPQVSVEQPLVSILLEQKDSL
jgi:hypothetical protein